jgi:predicted glycosyltransferase
MALRYAGALSASAAASLAMEARTLGLASISSMMPRTMASVAAGLSQSGPSFFLLLDRAVLDEV